MIAFVDDKEKFKKLRAMADKAQKAIKDSQDEAVEFVYELEMEIEGGSSTSETQTSSSEDAPAQNQSIDTSPNTSTAEPAPASTPQPAQSADSGTDFKALAAQLTGLVKMMIPMKADNPERFAELKVMADEAQKAIKASQDEAVKLVQDLDTAIAGGSSSAAPATASAEPASPPTPEGVDPAKHAALGASPKLWNDTVSSVGSAIDKLKDAIRKDFASEGADVVADIEKNLDRISKITERFDNTLADLLKAAHEATDEAARKQNITKAKSVLAEHIKYAASEPLIAMLDDNPFGVSTDIKKTLVANLQQLVDAVR
jgi:Sec-independent protein translocase protein TatA